MAYVEESAERVRQCLRRKRGFEERKMFGGVGFLLHGNMCCGVWKQFLILRIGVEKYHELLAHPDVREFDITGRAMKGWIMVQPSGFETDDALAEWVDQAHEFTKTLPRKL